MQNARADCLEGKGHGAPPRTEQRRTHALETIEPVEEDGRLDRPGETDLTFIYPHGRDSELSACLQPSTMEDARAAVDGECKGWIPVLIILLEF